MRGGSAGSVFASNCTDLLRLRLNDRRYEIVGEHHLFAIDTREDRIIGLGRPTDQYIRPQMVMFGLQNDRCALGQSGQGDCHLNGGGMLVVPDHLTEQAEANTVLGRLWAGQAGRVGDWRAGLGRSLCSLLARSFVCECHTISTMPRFQPPPRRTQHADFLALRSPVCFASRHMGPILPGRLSALVVQPDSP